MKSTLRVYEIPAYAGMKCSRVAPARNTRAKLGYVAGLCEPHNLGFLEQNNKVSFNYTNAFVPTHNRGLLNTYFWGTMART